MLLSGNEAVFARLVLGWEVRLGDDESFVRIGCGARPNQLKQ